MAVSVLTGGVAAAEVAPRRAKVVARKPKEVAPSATEVMTSYQRVGRDIIQLQNLRGTDCTLELWQTFRTIKLDQATATSAARIATTATLVELQHKITRRRGITIRQECLDNPLAEGCS